MEYDRKIIISAAAGRKSVSWPAQEMYWSEFCERVKTPVRSTETLAQYLKMTKAQQDELKDVGGFVGGRVHGARQKANVESRDLITLDLDNIPANGTDTVLRILDSLQCGYCVYSTRKHEPIKPRLRVVMPLSRTCCADEYEPVVRKVADMIGIEFADPVSFRSNQLMYWPSVCSDGEFIYRVSDRPMADPDGILALYEDWHDIASWPRQPGETAARGRLAKRQQDPTEKSGLVGAFCREYDVYRAMDELIPEAYLPTDKEDRYTYAGGTTTGGAIVYEGGKFLYSHHATDPAGGKLSNAFDLVRLHKFGYMDEEADPATPVGKLPSYTAMKAFAAKIPQVTAALAKERYDKAQDVFQTGPDQQDEEDDQTWMQKLSTSETTGAIEKTIANVALILTLDPRLKGRIAYDEFRRHIIVRGDLPWAEFDEVREWQDDDDAGLRWYLESGFGITGKDRVYDGLTKAAHEQTVNEVREYLENLPEWDGEKRLDSLFIDYLGAEDNLYTREVTRKSLTAAVARIMQPGIKFDNMVILTGPQGIGKSMLLKTLGGPWYSDSIVTFEGKDAAEALQGRWIVEVAELSAMGRSRTEVMKQFISRQDDIYRKAYGRRTDKYPRQCVIFGTTNEATFLRDSTGNRRFWPVGVSGEGKKDVFTDLPAERDQIWSEAVLHWKAGEVLYLSGKVAEMALEAQEERTEEDPQRGVVIEFLLKKVPENWSRQNESARRMYWATPHKGAGGKLRTRICATEIWAECFGLDVSRMTKVDSRRVNRILDSIEGLDRMQKVAKFGPYGAQRGYTISDVFYLIYGGEKEGNILPEKEVTNAKKR